MTLQRRAATRRPFARPPPPPPAHTAPYAVAAHVGRAMDAFRSRAAICAVAAVVAAACSVDRTRWMRPTDGRPTVAAAGPAATGSDVSTWSCSKQ